MRTLNNTSAKASSRICHLLYP